MTTILTHADPSPISTLMKDQHGKVREKGQEGSVSGFLQPQVHTGKDLVALTLLRHPPGQQSKNGAELAREMSEGPRSQAPTSQSSAAWAGKAQILTHADPNLTLGDRPRNTQGAMR